MSHRGNLQNKGAHPLVINLSTLIAIYNILYAITPKCKSSQRMRHGAFGLSLKPHSCNKIFASVIRWHTPCRGGYHPPGCFPMGKQRRRIAPTMQYRTLYSEIRRHRPCRGGYHPPGCFPMGKQRRRIAPTMQYRIFYNVIQRYNIEIWYICNIGNPIWPIRFCSKTCHVGGRLIAAPTRSVPLNQLGKNSVRK